LYPIDCTRRRTSRTPHRAPRELKQQCLSEMRSHPCNARGRNVPTGDALAALECAIGGGRAATLDAYSAYCSLLYGTPNSVLSRGRGPGERRKSRAGVLEDVAA